MINNNQRTRKGRTHSKVTSEENNVTKIQYERGERQQETNKTETEGDKLHPQITEERGERRPDK
jgi:hypothetical protein